MIHSANYEDNEEYTYFDENLTITLGYPIKNCLNVVVDVLRASSTIVTAMANGVDEIIFIDSKRDLLGLKKDGFLLVGEYKGLKLQKFDVGNSPVDLMDAIYNGGYKKVALKTTNTTKKLANMKEDTFIFASTLNISATIDFLSNIDKGVKINLMAVGGRNGFTEDLSVVLSLYSFLNDGIDINHEFLKNCILKSKNARYLSSIGYSKDIEFISRIDLYDDIVPMMIDGIIRAVQ